MTSDTASRQAKEAKILDLFDGWLNASPTADNLRAYLDAVADLSVEAVARSVGQFRDGLVERDQHAFAPSAPELAKNARTWQEAIDRRDNLKLGLSPPAHGVISVDFNGRRYDTSKLTVAQLDEAFATNGKSLLTGANAPSPSIGASTALKLSMPKDLAKTVLQNIRGIE